MLASAGTSSRSERANVHEYMGGDGSEARSREGAPQTKGPCRIGAARVAILRLRLPAVCGKIPRKHVPQRRGGSLIGTIARGRHPCASALRRAFHGKRRSQLQANPDHCDLRTRRSGHGRVIALPEQRWLLPYGTGKVDGRRRFVSGSRAISIPSAAARTLG